MAIEPRGRAYLFRGMIEMLDWGMDKLAQRINRAGVPASINSYVTWFAVANQAISDYRRDPAPITIIGHSMGGDAAVQFAKYLDTMQIPVNLLVTYDPTRYAEKLPPNVERYINLYKSSGFLGGGDIVQGRGFDGHYASFDLKDRPEIVHTNMDKFDRIQEQLVDKIKFLAATPAKAQIEAVPLRIVIPPNASIELWDSSLPVSAHDGDTLETLAAIYHVPRWALAQVNRTCSISWIGLPICATEPVALIEGQRIIIPRYLAPMMDPSPVWSYPPTGR